jgi:hypothetical protein
MRRTAHPRSASWVVWRASRWTFASSLSAHHVLLFFGAVLCSGQRCQKHPSTKTASFARVKITSGRPGSSAPCVRKRSPRRCSSLRKTRSGPVSLRGILDICLATCAERGTGPERQPDDTGSAPALSVPLEWVGCTSATRPPASCQAAAVPTWIYFYPQAQERVPPQMSAAADLIVNGAARLRGTQSDKGGLKRDPLRAVLHDLVGEHARHPLAGTTFASDQIDLMLNEAPVGISIHAGRAWMNNEALLAVLGAACAPDLDWLILVVPQSYMRSVQHPHIVQQIASLAAASGVDLDLQGVATVPF